MQNFFLLNCPAPAHPLHGVYDPLYVGLSYLVATLASYLALALARQLSLPNKAGQRRLLLWGGALALGIGIWSMHFVGMLAFNMGMPMHYDPWLTILSMLVAVFSAYGVLALTGRPRLKAAHLAAGAVVLGIGISAMHYLGMAALVMNADMRYRPDIFALSVAIGIAASGAALWISFNLARHRGKYHRYLEVCASLIMAVAICGMHYTGMAAAVFTPNPFRNTKEGISSNGLTLGLTLIGVILCLVLPVVIYHSINDEDQDGSDVNKSNFPTKLLWLAVVGNCGALMWVFGYSIYNAHLIQETGFNVADAHRVSANLQWIAFVAVMFSALLLGTWYFALRNIRVWRRELHSNRTLLRTIIDNMPLALHAKDAANDYRWLLMNPMAGRLFGLEPEDVIGHTDFERLPSEQAAALRQADEKIMAEGRLVDFEGTVVDTSRGRFTAHTINVPIFDADGKPHLLLGMTEDITERARAAEELRLAKEQAEQSDAAKSEFLANMSHELRTPLNSILGTVRLLQEASTDPNQRALCETVFYSSTSLLDIVNDILDLSKIASGAVALEQIGIDPDHILNCTMNRLEPLAREKKLTLSLVDNPRLPYVIGDPTRLLRILTNLISNAIKYTDSGSVRVSTTQKPVGAQNFIYRCEIIDTGIGIPAAKHASIFEKFTQADSSTTRKYGGTGLGLAITKQLVELMGGTIGVISAEGEGSTFWFEISFAVTENLHRERRRETRKLDIISAIPAADARVLIAEDHPMNQVLMRRLMARFGIDHYIIAVDGMKAVEAFKSGTWDLILMDCHMPEKNGYDATTDIRTLENAAGRPNVPIIAMTANAMVGDREKCLSYGMNDYISKPIAVETLASVMEQWIDLHQPEKETLKVEPLASACIDLAQLRSFTEGDTDLERELIKAFADQSTININALLANQKCGKNLEWVEAAHMLKGGAASIGAEKLRSLCEIAQKMADAEASARIAKFEEIAAAYTHVEQALKREGLLT